MNLLRLRYWRQRRALSQEDLAAHSGVAKATIVNLEALRTEAKPSTVRKLADALGVTPENLLERDVTVGMGETGVTCAIDGTYIVRTTSTILAEGEAHELLVNAAVYQKHSGPTGRSYFEVPVSLFSGQLVRSRKVTTTGKSLWMDLHIDRMGPLAA